MVKSTSCLKIIACGSESVDKDDLEVAENKASNEKRRWSFRKKPTSHRVLSNTVTSEIPSSGNKESPESARLDHIPPVNATVPEKISVIQSTNEKPQLTTLVNPEVIETVVAVENESKFDANPEESVVIVIQAAIRGFLGRIMLLKLKNVVKLQAAVRGHLVRSHAVGTLRCVQAIVKMQALVRARHVRLSLARSCPDNKLDGKHDADSDSSKTWENENLVNKSSVISTSAEKLLTNRFARQLLESTPKSQPIRVKCDSSKPNAAWKWLEMWMSVTSSNPEESKETELMTDKMESKKDESFLSQVESKVQPELLSESQNVNSNRESPVPSESEENLITYEASNFNFQAGHPNSSLNEELEQHQPDANETSLGVVSTPNQSTQTDSDSQVELNHIPEKTETETETETVTETEKPKRSMKRFASEELETEGKKFVFGSRKTTHPAFVATQSKFEELSSTENSDRSISSFHQDSGVESPTGTILTGADAVVRTKELSVEENLAPRGSRVQVGGSECGTELSISSTLDSPDRFEVGGATECEREAKPLEGGICDISRTENVDVKSKDASAMPDSNLLSSVVDRPEKPGDDGGEPINVTVAMDSPQVEPKLENSESIRQGKLDLERGHEPYRSSPEASPKSHITVPESHGTPSSQVSVKAKNSKVDNSGSNHKRKSHSGGKRTPSNPNNDSGSKIRNEQVPKDPKNGKRNNSFGSPRSDHIEQEPRDGSPNNSIPRFMQATESARAKVQANSSPRSSPDVQDRELYVKKRHSLPGANGRQGSPRIQRSISQAQQSAKGNGTYPHERKWQR